MTTLSHPTPIYPTIQQVKCSILDNYCLTHEDINMAMFAIAQAQAEWTPKSILIGDHTVTGKYEGKHPEYCDRTPSKFGSENLSDSGNDELTI